MYHFALIIIIRSFSIAVSVSGVITIPYKL
jgi:hypothetical protein